MSRAIVVPLALAVLGPLGAVRAQDTGVEALGALRDFQVCQTAYGDEGEARLSWVASEQFESFIAYLDGEPAQEALDGGQRTATIAVVPGVHEFGVRGLVGDFISPLQSVMFEILAESPVVNPVTEPACEYVPGAGGSLSLSWMTDESNDAWESGEIRLGGRRGNLRFGQGIGVLVRLRGERPSSAVVAFKNAENYFSDPIEIPCEQLVPAFRRGDCDENSLITISDAIFTLNHLFRGFERWFCDDACDANDSGSIGIDDAITTLNYIFLPNTPPPAPPGPDQCGIDPTPDFLGGICASSCD